ncbi:MAG: prolyl oligopeptidase family serine peptidase [Gammaproteobacteria bacterium]
MQTRHPAQRGKAFLLSGIALLAIAFDSTPPAQAQQPAPVTLRRESGNLVLEGIPPRDAAMGERLARYINGRNAKFLDWQPDGSLLVATRFGDVDQVHRVIAPLGSREQLTFYADPVSEAAANSNGFVFLKDKGGDENSQIYYYRNSDHSIRMLTDGKSLNGSPVWAHDGKRVAFHSNVRDGVSYDIYVSDVDANTAPRLAVGGQQETWYPLDWSPDDTKLLLWKYISINESYLFVADVATGSVTALDADATPASGKPDRRRVSKKGDGKVGIKSAKFAPDGRGIFILSDEGSEFSQLFYFDPVTHDKRLVSPEDAQWDVDAFDVSADGRYIAFVMNEDGRSRLTVIDQQMKLDLAPPGVPDGRITEMRFDRAAKRLAFSAESAQQPRDVYVYDLTKNALERWTRSEAGPVDNRTFVTPTLVHYPTWDRVAGTQRALSAYAYMPKTPGPHPVLVDIHGGPEEQYRPGYEAFFQFLVNELGYAVIAPNVRGSSGYGKTFLKLDNGVLREDSVKDIGSLLVWIGVQPMFDRDRVVVMGGSYGGYMTLASLVSYSDRLRGGVDIVGISNFNTFLNNTSAYRQDLRRQEYGDERDPKMRAFFSRISPFNNSTSIRRPLLVVQGLNDPRVPASESEQMVARVRANGGEAWYLAAKDEGHGFRKKSNRDFYLETVAGFLEKLAKK